MKKVFKADNFERTLRLNTRAILQIMRENNIEVADTFRINMKEKKLINKVKNDVNRHLNDHVNEMMLKNERYVTKQDQKILTTDENVKR